jgi:pantoate--beta-alanine ligase
LQAAKSAFKEGKHFEEVSRLVQKLVESSNNVSLEYFEIAESSNLNLLDNVKAAEKPIMCIAGFVGEVRLIDNMFLD